MTALFLAPHNDDETLFGAYSIMREAPDVHVVVCLESRIQAIRATGITATVRERETHRALEHLLGPDPEWWQWGGGCNDADPSWVTVRDLMIGIGKTTEYERVYAPVPYGADAGAHPQHDAIGMMAHEVFGTEGALAQQGYGQGVRVIGYHTYVNGRSRVEGERVAPQPHWILAKLRALACYESQIVLPSTGHHFAQALHEWTD